jgi:error-prone DNA polymerase
LDELKVIPASLLKDERRFRQGTRISVAGLVLVRQRPATASGIIFVTVEDESGVARLIIRPDVYEKYRRDLRHSVSILATGKVERNGIVVHILVDRVSDLRKLAQSVTKDLKSVSRDFH